MCSTTCAFPGRFPEVGPGCAGPDGAVLALAHAYQKQTEWHKKRPAAA